MTLGGNPGCTLAPSLALSAPPMSRSRPPPPTPRYYCYWVIGWFINPYIEKLQSVVFSSPPGNITTFLHILKYLSPPLTVTPPIRPAPSLQPVAHGAAFPRKEKSVQESNWRSSIMNYIRNLNYIYVIDHGFRVQFCELLARRLL